MVFVLNLIWGDFSLPQDYVDTYGLEDCYDFDDATIREDPRLIEWVRDHADSSGKCGDLGLVEIPANCTDYEINEYDGWESITYVVGGKLYHA